VRISGSSAGVDFENATVSTTEHITLDLATNDGPGASATVSATAAVFLAVPTTGFQLKTGPNSIGNVFTLDAQEQGIVLTQNSIQVVGAQPLVFDTLGTINLINPGTVTVVGTSQFDDLTVNATGRSSGTLRLNNGPLVVFNTLTSLYLNGNSGS